MSSANLRSARGTVADLVAEQQCPQGCAVLHLHSVSREPVIDAGGSRGLATMQRDELYN
ncbi:hypothetical protein Ptr902_03134 [Pyrenophora tritici-repentis]|uniref:Uncharacterized protein n=1 Tax=Pyrenophora tritici-repentis TaxID=45151 RepID=A0A5M9L5M1_9PLEO|nr:hypothetical protein PtrV1_08163 [Pyrenophora tritici-repentis]KAF7570789.1 hypothetical protein PtrM4_107910 [Pyrenophora tritici-repentis]KAI0589071.1 hypothetical protein Alg215_00464 [Pyrenophora tritici-repentis]KAI0591229.1 hypothetical protein Alg130_01422 [Pyrenophora tritici-repentis]KAI0615568.1 hypothetical protein TUN205_00156 [Pyrenophora tritici-repentis]